MADSGNWRPLTVRESGDFESWESLHGGVPSWLKASLWNWLNTNYFQSARVRSNIAAEVEARERVRILEQKLREDLGSDQVAWGRFAVVRGKLENDDDLFLNTIDVVLSTGAAKPYKELESILCVVGRRGE